MLGALVPDGTDQPDPALAIERKDGQEIGLVEVDMQLAIGRGAAG